MFADGFWSRLPPADGLAAFGMALDELADGVDGFAALGAEAGLDVEAVDVVDVAEWDDYEGSYADAVERWATANPDDPERVTFLERSSRMRSVVRGLAPRRVRLRHREVPGPGVAGRVGVL